MAHGMHLPPIADGVVRGIDACNPVGLKCIFTGLPVPKWYGKNLNKYSSFDLAPLL
jgi:hypothetical protein